MHDRTRSNSDVERLLSLRSIRFGFTASLYVLVCLGTSGHVCWGTSVTSIDKPSVIIKTFLFDIPEVIKSIVLKYSIRFQL